MKKLHKPNELIQVKKLNLTKEAIRSYNYILHEAEKFYKKNTEETEFHIAYSDMKKSSGSTITNSAYKIKLLKELKDLVNISYTTYDEKKFKTTFALISQFVEEEDLIKIELPKILRDRLKNNDYYTTLELADMSEFKSKYSLIVYQLIKRYNEQIPAFMPIEKFQDLMQYPVSYRNNDIEVKVLKMAQKELKKFSKINLSWEFRKVGTKITHITLYCLPYEKEKKEANEVTKEKTEKLQKAIDKARKNIHIDAKYSEKFMQRLIDNYEEKDIIKALSLAYTYNSEIKTFYGFMKATIEDIIDSKKKTPEPKPSVPETVVSDTDASDVAAAEVTEKIKMTQAEYEELYKAYLKEKNGEDSMFTRKFFDSLNKKKYEITEEVPDATDADEELPELTPELEIELINILAIEKNDKTYKNYLECLKKNNETEYLKLLNDTFKRLMKNESFVRYIRAMKNTARTEVMQSALFDNLDKPKDMERDILLKKLKELEEKDVANTKQLEDLKNMMEKLLQVMNVEKK